MALVQVLAQAQANNQWRFDILYYPAALAVPVTEPFSVVDGLINAHIYAVRLYMWQQHYVLMRRNNGRAIFIEALKLIGDNLVLSYIYAVTAVTEAEASLVKAQRIRNVLYHPLPSTARAALAAAEAICNDRLRLSLGYLELASQLSHNPSLNVGVNVWGIDGEEGQVTDEDPH